MSGFASVQRSGFCIRQLPQFETTTHAKKSEKVQGGCTYAMSAGVKNGSQKQVARGVGKVSGKQLEPCSHHQPQR